MRTSLTRAGSMAIGTVTGEASWCWVCLRYKPCSSLTSRIRTLPFTSRHWHFHRAVVEGDDRLAPRVDEQPNSLGMLADAEGSQAIDPLRRLHGNGSLVYFVVGILCVTFGLITVAVVATLPGHGVLAVALGLGLLGLAYGFVAAGLWLRRRLHIHEDVQGMWWRRPSGVRTRIDWQRSRAFYQAHYHGTMDRMPRTVYFLDGGDTVLTWWVKPASAEDAVSSRLARLIATHTRLPLRDVSEETERIAALPKALATLRQGQPYTAARQAGVPSNRLPSPPAGRGPSWGCLAPLLILALLAGASWGRSWPSRATMSACLRRAGHILPSRRTPSPPMLTPRGPHATTTNSAAMVLREVRTASRQVSKSSRCSCGHPIRQGPGSGGDSA